MSILPILACPPLAKAAKPCRDTLGSSASQFSILTLQKQGQVRGVLVAQSRTGTSPRTLISAVQLRSCSLAPSCFRVDTQGGGGSTRSPRNASPGAIGEEEEPWVQAACWPAARQRPRLVRHAWPQLRCPGQQAPPGLWEPVSDRTAQPQEGALSQRKAAPGELLWTSRTRSGQETRSVQDQGAGNAVKDGTEPDETWGRTAV